MPELEIHQKQTKSGAAPRKSTHSGGKSKSGPSKAKAKAKKKAASKGGVPINPSTISMGVLVAVLLNGWIQDANTGKPPNSSLMLKEGSVRIYKVDQKTSYAELGKWARWFCGRGTTGDVHGGSAQFSGPIAVVKWPPDSQYTERIKDGRLVQINDAPLSLEIGWVRFKRTLGF